MCQFIYIPDKAMMNWCIVYFLFCSPVVRVVKWSHAFFFLLLWLRGVKTTCLFNLSPFWSLMKLITQSGFQQYYMVTNHFVDHKNSCNLSYQGKWCGQDHLRSLRTCSRIWTLYISPAIVMLLDNVLSLNFVAIAVDPGCAINN